MPVKQDAQQFSATKVIIFLLLIIVIVVIIEESNDLFRLYQIWIGVRDIDDRSHLTNIDLCFWMGTVGLSFRAGRVGRGFGWMGFFFLPLFAMSFHYGVGTGRRGTEEMWCWEAKGWWVSCYCWGSWGRELNIALSARLLSCVIASCSLRN